MHVFCGVRMRYVFGGERDFGIGRLRAGCDWNERVSKCCGTRKEAASYLHQLGLQPAKSLPLLHRFPLPNLNPRSELNEPNLHLSNGLLQPSHPSPWRTSISLLPSTPFISPSAASISISVFLPTAPAFSTAMPSTPSRFFTPSRPQPTPAPSKRAQPSPAPPHPGFWIAFCARDLHSSNSHVPAASSTIPRVSCGRTFKTCARGG